MQDKSTVWIFSGVEFGEQLKYLTMIDLHEKRDVLDQKLKIPIKLMLGNVGVFKNFLQFCKVLVVRESTVLS
jgi:hypothetical protein